MEKFQWSIAPRYLFRISLAEEFLDLIGKKKFLEVGSGAGDFLVRLAKKGYSGVGIDYEDEAVAEAKRRLDHYMPGHSIQVMKKDVFELKEDNYELVLMMDVLEHIKEDVKTLQQVNKVLKPNGYFIMSVPCHMKKWCLTDEWGHVRRYERDELTKKLNDSGFDIIKFYCFGYPFLNMIVPIREFFLKRQLERDKKAKQFTQQETTKKSGLYRPFQRYFKFFSNKFFLWPFMLIQRPFFHYELGEGYVVLARKKEKL